MTIEEARQALQNMKSHFQGGFSYSEQRELERLNKLIFGKVITQTGCQDCYRDAFILLSTKLRTMNELPKEPEYELKAGIVLRRFGSNDLYFREMKTEDAERWLREHPADITKFQRYPADWQTRINVAQIAPQVTEVQTPADTKNAAEKGVKTRTRRRKANKK